MCVRSIRRHFDFYLYLYLAHSVCMCGTLDGKAWVLLTFLCVAFDIGMRGVGGKRKVEKEIQVSSSYGWKGDVARIRSI